MLLRSFQETILPFSGCGFGKRGPLSEGVSWQSDGNCQLDGADVGPYPPNLLVDMAATGQIHRDNARPQGGRRPLDPRLARRRLFADDATDSAWLTIGDETESPVFAEAVPERGKQALTIALGSAALVLVVWRLQGRASRELIVNNGRRKQWLRGEPRSPWHTG